MESAVMALVKGHANIRFFDTLGPDRSLQLHILVKSGLINPYTKHVAQM